MHLWKAGELITADKLTPRILSGAELMTLPDQVPSGAWPTYYRGEREITFPSGFFKSAPQILVTGRSGVPGVLLEVSYSYKSANGFTVFVARANQTETWVDWVAMEVPEY